MRLFFEFETNTQVISKMKENPSWFKKIFRGVDFWNLFEKYGVSQFKKKMINGIYTEIWDSPKFFGLRRENMWPISALQEFSKHHLFNSKIIKRIDSDEERKPIVCSKNVSTL